jgi:hypothetical protein
MHITQLSLDQVKQEIGVFSQQRDLAYGLGMKKHVKLHSAYLKALHARLNELQPIPQNIDNDQLLAELGITL